jgi:pyruvate-ferredoxin/flavodoxin oxidoreductase
MTAPTVEQRTLDGNEAVTSVAYRLSEVVAIYPITPVSVMGEHADDWSALRRPNLWGAVPEIVEMQSKGGAAGGGPRGPPRRHAGDHIYRVAGPAAHAPEPLQDRGGVDFVLHARRGPQRRHARAVDLRRPLGRDGGARHRVGDSGTGSVQKAQDFAAVGHAATLAARVSVLHFFDGFRTSHEVAKIVTLGDDTLTQLLDPKWAAAHHERRLTPDRPVVRGTSQNPDAFFQSREAANPYYDAFPDHLDQIFRRFESLTGRKSQAFDYHRHLEADRVIVLMGSGAECVHETVDWLLEKGERVGVLKVRLFRPFSAQRFLAALPTTVRHVAVLDRTKEPGSAGEPILLEVGGALLQPMTTGVLPNLPRVIGGRYGLSSKKFTPAMAKAVFDELRREVPKTRFTVGIRDDVTHLSLDADPDFEVEPDDVVRAVFYGLGSDGTVSSNKASIKIIGEQTDRFAQGHFVDDSKKAGSTTVSHLRFGPRPIRSSYQIRKADFVAIHDPGFLDRLDVLERTRNGAVVLLNTPTPADRVWETLPRDAQEAILTRRCRLYVIDAYTVAENAGLGRRINTVMQACFYALARVLPVDQALDEITKSIAATWGKRGPEVVRRNVAAVDAVLAGLDEVPLPSAANATRHRRPAVPESAPEFVQRVSRLLLEGQGTNCR